MLKLIKYIPCGKTFYSRETQLMTNAILSGVEVKTHTAVSSICIISSSDEFMEVLTETGETLMVSDNNNLYHFRDGAEKRDATWNDSLLYSILTFKMIDIGEIVTIKSTIDSSFQAKIKEVHVLIEEDKVFVSYLVKSLVSQKTWKVNPEDILS